MSEPELVTLRIVGRLARPNGDFISVADTTEWEERCQVPFELIAESVAEVLRVTNLPRLDLIAAHLVRALVETGGPTGFSQQEDLLAAANAVVKVWARRDQQGWRQGGDADDEITD